MFKFKDVPSWVSKLVLNTATQHFYTRQSMSIHRSARITQHIAVQSCSSANVAEKLEKASPDRACCQQSISRTGTQTILAFILQDRISQHPNCISLVGGKRREDLYILVADKQNFSLQTQVFYFGGIYLSDEWWLSPYDVLTWDLTTIVTL